MVAAGERTEIEAGRLDLERASVFLPPVGGARELTGHAQVQLDLVRRARTCGRNRIGEPAHHGAMDVTTHDALYVRVALRARWTGQGDRILSAIRRDDPIAAQ